MDFLEEDLSQRVLRRIIACTHTLYRVAEELDDLDEEVDDEITEEVTTEKRGDLLIAVENLIDIAMYVTDSSRGIAWRHTLTPEEIANQED